MKNIWKYTAVLTLLFIGGIQVLPFVSTHEACQAACCIEETSCCESAVYSGCEMAMTSCSAVMIMPMMSAPLLKVESNVNLDVEINPIVLNLPLFNSEVFASARSFEFQEAPPPPLVPLLI